MQYNANTYAEGKWDVYRFEKNLLGDIIAVYNSSRTKLVEYNYYAWGTFSASYKNGGQNTTATKNSLGYRGYYYDKDLEMYYLASRYYDAKICRFISPDDLSYISAQTEIFSPTISMLIVAITRLFSQIRVGTLRLLLLHGLLWQVLWLVG